MPADQRRVAPCGCKWKVRDGQIVSAVDCARHNALLRQREADLDRTLGPVYPTLREAR